MDKEYLTSLIYDKLGSKEFNSILEKINSNYPNLKQELFIRNEILESLNKEFSNCSEKQYRAFAEHPRGIKGARIDLSIADKSNLDNPLLVEFKFQFPDDLIKFDYTKTIEKDFQSKKHKNQTDLFILFVACWDIQMKNKFDTIWNIDSNLSRYQVSEEKNIVWKDKLYENFKAFNNESIVLEPIIQNINQPYNVKYHIFILKRKN